MIGIYIAKSCSFDSYKITYKWCLMENISSIDHQVIMVIQSYGMKLCVVRIAPSMTLLQIRSITSQNVYNTSENTHNVLNQYSMKSCGLIVFMKFHFRKEM